MKPRVKQLGGEVGVGLGGSGERRQSTCRCGQSGVFAVWRRAGRSTGAALPYSPVGNAAERSGAWSVVSGQSAKLEVG